MNEGKDKLPFIIACGETKNSIHQYLIYIDNNLIPLKLNTTILQALDILYQLYFLLDINYDKNLKNFFIFIQVFVYEIAIPEKKIPTTVNEQINKFKRTIASDDIIY